MHRGSAAARPTATIHRRIRNGPVHRPGSGAMRPGCPAQSADQVFRHLANCSEDFFLKKTKPYVVLTVFLQFELFPFSYEGKMGNEDIRLGMAGCVER